MTRVRKTPQQIAERTLNHCCEGNPIPTARRLLAFEAALARLAFKRCVQRVRNQPRNALRCSGV